MTTKNLEDAETIIKSNSKKRTKHDISVSKESCSNAIAQKPDTSKHMKNYLSGILCCSEIAVNNKKIDKYNLLQALQMHS